MKKEPKKPNKKRDKKPAESRYLPAEPEKGPKPWDVPEEENSNKDKPRPGR